MSHIADKVWRRLTDMLSGELEQDELCLLVSPRLHLSLLSRRRAIMIVNRVRLFAFLFAVMTPVFSVADLVVFPISLWLTLALMRVLACAAFTSLVLRCRSSGDQFDAYRAIALLFTIPTVFYVASYTLLAHYHLAGISAAVGVSYAFLPFVLLAGLAIFPLTLLETLAIASPILIAQAIAGSLRWATLDWPSFVGAFWLLVLIAGVSTLACMSQLAFIIALVRQAIRDPLTDVFSRGSAEEVLD